VDRYPGDFLLSLRQNITVATMCSSKVGKDKAATFVELMFNKGGAGPHMPLGMLWRNVLALHASPSMAPAQFMSTSLPQDAKFMDDNPAVSMAMWGDMLAGQVSGGRGAIGVHQRGRWLPCERVYAGRYVWGETSDSKQLTHLPGAYTHAQQQVCMLGTHASLASGPIGCIR
jgi:hypothetical protein